MGWLRREPAPSPQAPHSHPETDPDADPGAPIPRRSPGIAALFQALPENAGHSILDLGPGGGRHVDLLAPYAHRIRFAGLLPLPPTGVALVDALRSIPPTTAETYDIVLAWDVFDRLGTEDREVLARHLDRITEPRALLYAAVDATASDRSTPARITLVDHERVEQHPAGPSHAAYPPLLPAHVERLLRPFEVIHGYSLRVGIREYVARKP